MYGTSSLIVVRWWISLTSMETFPFPLHDLKPCSVSWKYTAPPIQQLTNPNTAFQMTSTIPIPWNSLSPLAMRTTVFHINSTVIHHTMNVYWIISTTLYHFSDSVLSSLVASAYHAWIFAAIMNSTHFNLYFCILFTAHPILSTVRMD